MKFFNKFLGVYLLSIFLFASQNLNAQLFIVDGVQLDPNQQNQISRAVGADVVLELRVNSMGMMPDLRKVQIQGATGAERNPDAGGMTCSGNIVDYVWDDRGCDSGVTGFDMINNIYVDTAKLTFFTPATGQYVVTLTAFTNENGSFENTDIVFTLNVAPASVPTLSQWGLFLFILLILSLGLVTIYNVQLANATTGTALAQQRFTIPFDWQSFKRMLVHATGIAMVAVPVIMIIWGKIVPHDIVGCVLMIPMVAYLLHLIKQMKA